MLRSKGFLVQRIESGTTGRGIPDVYWAKSGRVGWIELKVIHHKFKGIAADVTWRPGQNVWMYRHNRIVPGSCFTLLADPYEYYQIGMDKIYKPMEMVRIEAHGSKLTEVLG